jgi:hypothetical protein
MKNYIFYKLFLNNNNYELKLIYKLKNMETNNKLEDKSIKRYGHTITISIFIY